MPDRDADGPVRAAGAVVWREAGLDQQLVLVHRPRYDDWSFPKGKSEQGEHVLLTVTREVAEETGLQIVLGRRLTPSEYEVGDRVKHVTYWAARCVGSLGFTPTREVDELAWLPARQVRDRLSYDRDVLLLDEFTAGPASSVPFILLRHAEAGAKPAGAPVDPALDLARPLDARGRADAKRLAELLASYGRCRVLSSAAERCVATVQPYAAAIGAPVQVESAFTAPANGPPGADGAAAAARVVIELVTEGTPTLVCAHRENLPAMTDAARSVLGASALRTATLGRATAAGLPLRKGAFLVLQSADGVLVSQERHDLMQ
jgi:8-oxo-dGTP pyrophosphatase MutT (NUDIX family)/phosphohistidine phosphatase SixA